MLPPLFLFIMYPHFFDGAKKRRYPPKKRFPTPAVCSRKRCPLHKGTKALHRKNGGSDSRPPSFRPTAVFILHLPPGYLWLFFNGMGSTPFRPRCGHLPSRGGHPSGLPAIPLPSPSVTPPLKGRSFARWKAEEHLICLLRRHFPSRGRLPSGNPFFGRIISAPTFFNHSALCTMHCALKKHPYGCL